MTKTLNPSINNKRQTIAISITEGRVIRDLFDGGLLELLKEANLDVIIFTPSARVKAFVDIWENESVRFAILRPFDWTVKFQRLYALRKKVMRFGTGALKISLMLERMLVKSESEYVNSLLENNVQLLVITHPMYYDEYHLLRAGDELGLPSIGILRSWDNFYRGLRLHPKIIAVWNPINAKEAIDIAKYEREFVKIIGGTQFDPYFQANAILDRDEFFHSFSLDSTRPLLTIATLGSFIHMYDETYLIDIILDAITNKEIQGNPQLIIRLHPSSKLELFEKYTSHPDVRLSYISGYVPAIGWTMSRKDVRDVASILKYSNVIISPGSTITIESAIFDTPTILPIFHSYQPELGRKIYNQHLSTHFHRLAEEDLVPIVDSPKDLFHAINKALDEPTWYKNQRAQLVKDYIYFTDGCSVKRLHDLILEMLPKAL
jgi:hypothetical protein